MCITLKQLEEAGFTSAQGSWLKRKQIAVPPNNMAKRVAGTKTKFFVRSACGKLLELTTEIQEMADAITMWLRRGGINLVFIPLSPP